MKKIFIFLIIIILGTIGIYLYNLNKIKVFDRMIFYMDTNIYIKIYEKDNKKANIVLDQIENIYKTYNNLTDKYNSYSNLNNIYLIDNNVLNDEYLEIDEKLYDLIEYGLSLYQKSNGKIDITMGNVLDIWKGYREAEYGIPSLEELEFANNNKISKVELKNGKIKNNNLNLDLGCIAKGYATEEVKKYLLENSIDKYIINAGGNVIVGSKYSKELYKVGLENPNDSADVYKVIYLENKAIVTSGGYLRYYEYEGFKYNHIIDPDTLYPANNMKSVTVITEDSKYADFMSTYLFLLSPEEGLKIVNENDDIEAIWYLNDDTIITSKGFNKYEQK